MYLIRRLLYLISVQNNVNKELFVIDVLLKSNKLLSNYSKTYFVPFSNKRKILLIPLILQSVVILLKKNEV